MANCLAPECEVGAIVTISGTTADGTVLTMFEAVKLMIVTPLADAQVYSVELCPDYAPNCGNVARGTAQIGDSCYTPCALAFNGGYWCPTTADLSGDGGTPWGWCAAPGQFETNKLILTLL